MVNYPIDERPSAIEVIRPDPDIVAMTKTILEQNAMILKMNADLLKNFTLPVFVKKMDPTR